MSVLPQHADWRSAPVTCEPGYADAVNAFIFEAGFSAVEERVLDDRTVFIAFYPVLPDVPDPVQVLTAMLAAHAAPDGTPPARIGASEAIPDTDWETEWRAGLAPVETGARLVVRPSWVPYDNTGGRHEIIIDPKMAFGTGGHATTMLCLEALERLDVAGKSMLDAGCGSGVLAVAAVKLGVARVLAFDYDPGSVDNARENVALNGAADRVTVREADLTTIEPGRFDLVVANVISGVLIPTLPRFRDFLEPGGLVVFSGLLATEEDVFTACCREVGFTVRGVTHHDEWIAIEAE